MTSPTPPSLSSTSTSSSTIPSPDHNNAKPSASPLSARPHLFTRLFSRPFSPTTKLALSILTWTPVAIFFFDNFYYVSWVSGRSMYPTFSPDTNAGARDLVLLEKYRAKNDLEKGQIIVYRSPIDPEITAVKRIVATEGDVVFTKKPFPHPEVIIPRNHVWVEGDDVHSLDSNHFGPISAHLIQAKVTRILWPYYRFGRVQQNVSREADRRVAPAANTVVIALPDID